MTDARPVGSSGLLVSFKLYSSAFSWPGMGSYFRTHGGRVRAKAVAFAVATQREAENRCKPIGYPNIQHSLLLSEWWTDCI